MSKFWNVVARVVDAADIVLLVLDARMVDETRNRDIERMVKEKGRPLIYVITKCDLVEKDLMEQWKRTLSPCVFVSATKYHGLAMLKERICVEASRAGLDKEKIEVGVLGYPNVGKSSLINAMTGRGSAKASPLAGLTRGKKRIASLRGGITFIDTPGVIPFAERHSEESKLKHAIIGAVDYNQEKEPDLVVIALMEQYPGLLEKEYSVPVFEDKEETLACIAIKRRLFLKGQKPDLRRAAVMILKDWQAGKIKPGV